jgi:hypothetical protein
MGVMKAVLRFEMGQILPFALLSFFIMLSLEGVFMRLLCRRQRGADKTGDTVRLKRQATRSLDEAQARLPELMPSVTEHTTRAFDPIYRERTSK